MNKVAYYNGNVYTSDVTAPTAQAFVVENGRFAFVGNDADLPPCDRRIDLKGKCVIPGLVDSHCHILSGMEGAFSDMIFISPDTKPEELAGVLSSLVSENPVPMNRAVIAMGFDLTKGDFSAKDIDSAFPDQPVLICSNDGHAALVNTKAMEILGIDRDIEDFGTDSYYVRDDKGDPTGLVIEIPAMRRCKQLLKYGADIDHAGQMKALCGSYAALGYTTVFDAMSVDEDNDEMISALSTLDKEGGLTLRTVLSFGFHDEECFVKGNTFFQ